MNRLLSMAFLLLPAATLLASPQAFRLQSGQSVRQETVAPPERDVEYVADGVIVTYTFTDAVIRHPAGDSSANMWKTGGFANIERDGLPSIPVRCDLFYLDSGFDVSVTLVEESHMDYHIALAGSTDPLPDDGSVSEKAVSEIKEYSGFFPAAPVELSQIQRWRERDILYVNVWPAQYDMKNETVRAYTSLKFKIGYTATVAVRAYDAAFERNLDFPFEGIATPVIEENTPSKETALGGFIAIPMPEPSYVIITTPTLRLAAEKFAEWKKILGYNTTIVTQENWTAYMIKDCIRTLYKSNKYITNVMFLGSHQDVPAHSARAIVSRSFVTDNPYVCMDGDDDFIPEMQAGRIPALTLEEAMTVVDKIINYQYQPVRDGYFYSNAVHCAQFQDESVPYHYEDRRFTLTSEEILNYVTSQFHKNVRRLYKLTLSPSMTEDNRPTNWNNDFYADGSPLPAPLNSETFNWQSNATNVNTAIRSGCHYLLYRGHGSPSGWAAPAFSTTSIASLNNQDKLPIVFSITCQTGMFSDPNCFAKQFITKKNGGALAVVAAAYTSYSGNNDVIAECIISSIFGGTSLIPGMPGVIVEPTTVEKATTLGGVLQAALAVSDHTYFAKGWNYTKVSRELYHVFGDPSIMLYTEDPYRSYPAITMSKIVTFGTDRVNVTGSNGGDVGVYDTLAGKCYARVGDGPIQVANPDYCVVSIREKNRPILIYKGSKATLTFIQ